MTARPYFRTRYGVYTSQTGAEHAQIRGRLEVRRVDPADPTRSRWSSPVAFQFDTGAELSAVSTEFAHALGFADYRSLGYPTVVGGYDDATATRPGWVVRRWVRFRDYENDLTRPIGSRAGGIGHLEFLIRFVVVEGATIEVPIIGLIDTHTYFSIGSAGDEYWFLMNVGEDGIFPAAPGGGEGVRRIP